MDYTVSRTFSTLYILIDIIWLLTLAGIFLFLKKRLNLSDGNLSSHLRVLEEDGCIHINKTFVGKKPKTYIKITPKGRRILLQYLDELASLMGKEGI